MINPLTIIAIVTVVLVSSINRQWLNELPVGLSVAVAATVAGNSIAMILVGFDQPGLMLALLMAGYCLSLTAAFYSLCNYAFLISGRLWGRRRERIVRTLTLVLIAILVTESLFIYWADQEWPFPWGRGTDLPLVHLLLSTIAGGLLLVKTLHKGALETRCPWERLRCKYLWLTSGVFLIFSVLYMMPILAGVQTIDAVYPGFMLALLVSSFVLVVDRDRLTVLTALIPGTPENRMHSRIHGAGLAASRYKSQDSEMQYRNMVLEFEIAVIEYVLQECGGNQSRAASVLGLSESTLSRRIFKARSAQRMNRKSNPSNIPARLKSDTA